MYFKRIFQEVLFLCCCLLLLEVVSRELLSVRWINRHLIKTNCDFMWRLRWVEKHKEGVQIYYRFDRYDPTKGWGIIPNISNMSCFNKKFINSNSKGIRGKTEYEYIKDKSKLRILCLGDSFTFGEEVNDNETYPYYLQQMLPNTEVINMGVHGYGHDQMLIYLKEEGIKYRPDIIILGYMFEDNFRNMLEFRDYAKPRIKLINNKLRICNIPVPAPEVILKWEPWRSRFVGLFNVLMYDISFVNGSYMQQTERITYDILKEIAVVAKNIGAVPIFVNLSNVQGRSSQPEMAKEYKNFLDKCEYLPVKWCSLRHKINSSKLSQTKIKEMYHFDPGTNFGVALEIKEYLLKNGFLEKK